MRGFTEEEYRISANLEQVYEALKEARLAQRRSANAGTSDRLDATTARLNACAAGYRAKKLPMTMNLPAKILQEMDLHGLLGSQFLVVGSFGFAAYEMEAGRFFLDGLESTEDFDVSWRHTACGEVPPTGLMAVSIDGGDSAARSLFDVIRSVDNTFAVSMFSPHKLRNNGAFDIDVLCCRGAHFSTEVEQKNKIFGGALIPVELDGQDILHMGRPLRHIVVACDGEPSPLVVPDPRCMAIHKQWLSAQPDRSSLKRSKDAKQAAALWNACKNWMPGYPVDAVFLAGLPDKWRATVAKLEGSVIPVVTRSPAPAPR